MRPLRPAGAILCFHGIASPATPGEGEVHLSDASFRAFVDAARRMGTIVPLRELVQRHLAGRGTAGLVALTADDAYASLLGETAAFIERESIPFTVFAVTEAAATRGGQVYWWDRVDDLFARTEPDRWRAFEDACGLGAEYRRGQPAKYGPLRPFRQWMLATHLGRWPRELEPELESLERSAGVRTAQRSMTFAELERFAAIPTVDLGVHTVTHPVLPLLADAELDREIGACYHALRERFSNTVPVLALPFGLFDRRTLVAGRRAGMLASLTLAGTTLRRYAGRDDLPRFCICRQDSPRKLRVRLTGLLDPGRWLRSPPPQFPLLPSATT